VYPEPYVRGKNGGVWKKAKDPEEEDMLVYPYDLYIVKRMDDPVEGDVAFIRYHAPKDGVKEFVVHNSILSDPQALRKILSSKGVLAQAKQFLLIAEYLLLATMAMAEQNKAETMRLQFGWVDQDSKFIAGTQEITATGIYYSPPSSATKELAPLIGPVGSYEKWQEVFNLYGKEGMEGHAFAALTGFAAPLFKFAGQTRNGICQIVGLNNIRYQSNRLRVNCRECSGTQAGGGGAAVALRGVRVTRRLGRGGGWRGRLGQGGYGKEGAGRKQQRGHGHAGHRRGIHDRWADNGARPLDPQPGRAAPWTCPMGAADEARDRLHLGCPLACPLGRPLGRP
jgi:hypothetical protein